MRSTTIHTVMLGAMLALGACSDDSTTAPSAEAAPELAKGGRKAAIAFAHKEADGTFQVYTMLPNGVGLKRITSGPSSNFSPKWTADRSRIVFVSSRDGAENVYIMDADGTNVVRLTNSGCADRNPAPSPDGTKVAFQRACAGGGIFTVNVDGTNPTQATVGHDMQPAWFPNSAGITFARLSGDGTYDIMNVVLHALYVSTVLDCGPITDCKAPAWAPAADGLAYWSSANNGSVRLHGTGLPANGIELAGNIGPATETDFAPAWSPDGKKIVFVASIEGVDLYSVNRDGTGFAPFLEQPNLDVSPSWYR